MKITKKRLREIIKEELELAEQLKEECADEDKRPNKDVEEIELDEKILRSLSEEKD